MYYDFYVNYFKPVATDNTHPGYVQPPALPIEVDGETKYKITPIVDSCLFRKIKIL